MGICSFGRETRRHIKFSLCPFARVYTHCIMFQDPTFTVDSSNLSANDTQSTTGSFALDGTRFSAKPGRKRLGRNNLKKSITPESVQIEYIHTLHSPMEWTQEPQMSSFAHGG